jgi:hypothetical protein
VVIGDYYYDDRTKSIEKRSNKRKRGESSKSISSMRRVVEWKARPNPKENVVQATSTLHAFVGLNASSNVDTNALSIA